MACLKSDTLSRLKAKVSLRLRSSSTASSPSTPNGPDSCQSGRRTPPSRPPAISHDSTQLNSSTSPALGSSGFEIEELQVPEPVTGHVIEIAPSEDALNETTSTAISSSDVSGANQAFHDAINKVVEQLDERDREAFRNSYVHTSPEKSMETIRKLDEYDGTSKTRTGAKGLGPAIVALDTAMTSIGIAIQHSPEISSLVIGGVRLIIDLVAKFVQFYNKLSQMICQMVDYVAVFDQYSKHCSSTIVRQALADIYCDLLNFCVHSRRVFVNRDGTVKNFSHMRTFIRVQWQPFEDKFGDIKASFAHHLNVLVNSAHAQQLSLLNSQSELIISGFNSAEVEMYRIQTREQIEERRKFLGWVSNIDYEATFEDMIKKKHTGTGEWLLADKTFQSWIKSQSSSLLWCHGKAGAGKSVLSSLVLDHISSIELVDSGTCVVFAYYSYQTPERHPLEKLLGSLIRQLTSKLKEVPGDVLTFFQTNYRDARSPRSDDLEVQFFNLLREFPSQALVVVDGLDECESGSREEILAFIARLVKEQSALIKVFVTSRRDEDIMDTFDGCPVVEIDSTCVDADIKIFLQDEIARRIHEKKLKLQKIDLKDAILEALSSKSNGMFMWAKLQLNIICEERRDQDILKALVSLPRDLYSTYDRILQKIEQKSPALQELARKALMWVMYAKRSMRIKELVDALAIQEGMTQYKELANSAYDKEAILDSCGGLLLSIGLLGTFKYELLSYTADHLAAILQCRRCRGDPAEASRKFVKFNFPVNANTMIISTNLYDRPEFGQLLSEWTKDTMSRYILHQAALSDLHTAVTQLLDMEFINVDERDDNGVTALMYAAQNGLYSMAYRLIVHGNADVTIKSDRIPDYTALTAACEYGNIDILRLLIQHKAGVSEKDVYWACGAHCNDDEILRILLKHGALATSQALEESARSGWIDRCALLVDHGALITGTVLMASFDEHGRPGPVTVLLLEKCDQGLLSEANVLWACTPRCRDDAILEHLLSNGAGATSEALLQAVTYGFYHRCTALLDHGALVTEGHLIMAKYRSKLYSDIFRLIKSRSSPALIAKSKVGYLERLGEVWSSDDDSSSIASESGQNILIETAETVNEEGEHQESST
ncbi:hypothetical protein ONS96_000905 [Cadophora gregata f. sp. sojae]|nr:hypothetical protein ONS96_000905 [Cadophora gregata f. sp. sojae]